jgi:hypothetical protein
MYLLSSSNHIYIVGERHSSRAMFNKLVDGQWSESKLFIFLNDFTDSDNEAAAEIWAGLVG